MGRRWCVRQGKDEGSLGAEKELVSSPRIGQAAHVYSPTGRCDSDLGALSKEPMVSPACVDVESFFCKSSSAYSTFSRSEVGARVKLKNSAKVGRSQNLSARGKNEREKDEWMGRGSSHLNLATQVLSGEEWSDSQGKLHQRLEKLDLLGMEHNWGLKRAMDSGCDDSLFSLERTFLGDKAGRSHEESFILESLALETFVEQAPVTVEFATHFSKFVGVSCDGEVGKLYDVFGTVIVDIESNSKVAGRAVEEGGAAKARSGKKSVKELNNLNSSTNYDVHNGSSLRDRSKGRAFRVIQ